ncbi:uncharacterized protein BHQ10_005583 [Talaromyces amestolkiae]|uniref:DUF7702 domain-containing protein n=1 Tax=Talaromyces amestolkiae TaxID=1196081 RepID=A0A364L1G1_TALAM|nr:uncharacterized protein BHQ10_005583 [Talaromyces amestolkiae]RAO69571.1 hypothetical protein BHQ10_005583 [Talaromyces amestolkiae]
MLNEHTKVSIAQIVFYVPAAVAAAGLLFFRRPIRELPRFPWVVLLIFTLVRIAGGIVVILHENQPSSSGLLIAALILLNVGVFPCIAATIGLVNIITFIDFRENKILAKTIVCSRLLFLAGVAVLITGGCLQGSDSSGDLETGTKLVRIGYCLVTVFVACLLSFQIFFWLRKSKLSHTSFNNIAFTAPINPPGATPVLSKEQVWAGLLLKTRSAETFIPNAIETTTVISENTDASTGNIITVREVLFRENQKRVKETVTAYKDARVDFVQPDGSFVGNIISEGASGEMYMTYVFEWHHPGASQEELNAFYAKEKGIAQHSVEGTVDVIRKLVKEGRL